jgi:zinc protease
MDATLMDMLAIRAVGNRLSRAQPDSPPGKVGMFIENGEQGHRLIMLWDNFAGNAWQPALAGLRRTTCQLGMVGFSDEEWSTARQDVIQDLEQQTRDMVHVPNVELAKDLSHALAAGRDLIPPDALLRRAQTWLPTIGRRIGSGWWHRQWGAGVHHVRVEAPDLAQLADPGRAIRATLDGASTGIGCEVRRD